ncbi:MAG: aspartate carbamoyltransferase regulatory subunit [Lachnospiraceae bacterium]|uniref:Aspartate carbamoyltransferase regulatory subunit n=1 Tax=Hominifimenecus microfluidus TaxID=2885348 RepID=A0AAE3E8E9_9FIRM|nr:aspartate carbamoyltransferase regulatory subunit [Hominifimenecus microfluidus]MCC2229812.1 aspartate carbamoyltransferase regulatory subunit [Hominifimenecus microfluidus]
MTVDSIEKGIVIDHIKAGKSMEIYQALNLDELDCSVAIIKNVKSNKMGFKDIIKISDTIDLNLDVLGYIDPNITVNIIEDGRRIEKKRLELPEKVVNVAHCKNPRCITSIEQELDHVFRLADRERGIYRCIYCDQKPGKEQ